MASRTDGVPLGLGRIARANPTGSVSAGRILGRLVDGFERAFPGRVRAYFVEGSRADRTGLATGDLDVTIVFKGRLADETEHRRGVGVGGWLAEESALELDLDILDEAGLAGAFHRNGVCPRGAARRRPRGRRGRSALPRV